MKKTPMMEQYFGFKRQYPDKLLLFRMGDFYETFGDDAKLAAKILNITLTTRDKATDPTPLAGFPHHALEQYLPKVIQAGYCAVVVDQLEDPKLAKGVVKRGVTRIVTPGTLDGELADARKNSYLLALVRQKGILGAALADISTGEFKLAELRFSEESVNALLNAYYPAEILLLEDESGINVQNYMVQLQEKKFGRFEMAKEVLLDFYKSKSLDSLYISQFKPAVSAAAMLLDYIKETQKSDPEHISRPAIFNLEGTMILDRSTIRNLDLVANSYSGSVANSLIEILDECKTRMGRRVLYSWVLNPLLNIQKVNSRLDTVEFFLKNSEILMKSRELLGEISDIQRIIGKIGLNRASARDMKALQYSVEKAAEIANLLGKGAVSEEFSIAELFDSGSDEGEDLMKLIKVIESVLVDNPPVMITEGGIIKSGVSAEVDELRSVSGNSKDWVKEFIEEEKKKTGISTLKIGFNKVFGYYIEVTNTHKDKVPSSYIRKQTLVNCERFITEELKKREEVILGAEEKLAALEYKLFQELRTKLLPYIEILKSLAERISQLDVLAGFAHLSRNHLYIRPVLHDFGENDGIIRIIGGRHPVVERISAEEFVSNDTLLSVSERMSIITGPNMAGKSTYIRQVALIVLMAQMGCYVPAESAEISIVDRIFSRVGAADNLSQGRSTFMVEMEEAANILNSATENSLIILDEVGRGTSTYDGVSIAWSLAEHLVGRTKARTLFATHYHELLKLAAEFPDVVKNYNVLVKEDYDNDQVVFLRKIVEGGTDRSYGIYVAKMAGLPEEVIARSKEILKGLEKPAESIVQQEKAERVSKKIKESAEAGQMTFISAVDSEIVKKLKEIDINNLTPIQSLELLDQLKKLVK